MASAFSKMVGFDVIPVRASPAIRASRVPVPSIARSMKSSQMDWPAAWRACSGVGVDGMRWTR